MADGGRSLGRDDSAPVRLCLESSFVAQDNKLADDCFGFDNDNRLIQGLKFVSLDPDLRLVTSDEPIKILVRFSFEPVWEVIPL